MKNNQEPPSPLVQTIEKEPLEINTKEKLSFNKKKIVLGKKLIFPFLVFSTILFLTLVTFSLLKSGKKKEKSPSLVQPSPTPSPSFSSSPFSQKIKQRERSLEKINPYNPELDLPPLDLKINF